MIMVINLIREHLVSAELLSQYFVEPVEKSILLVESILPNCDSQPLLGKTNSTNKIDFSTGSTKDWDRSTLLTRCSLITLVIIFIKSEILFLGTMVIYY